MPGSQKIIVVDAKNEYREIDKGRASAGWRRIDFGYTTDWAIAVGDFDSQTDPTGKQQSLPAAQ
jgi:hypothetical protein